MKQDLPGEVLQKIFGLLPQEELNKTVALVCKQWYDVMQSFCLIKNIVKLRSPYYQRNCNTYPTFGSRVNSITIENQECDGANEICPVIDSCSNLERLEIQAFNPEFFSSILKKLHFTQKQFKTALKILKLIFISLPKPTDKHFDWQKPKHTEVINLKKLINHDFPGLEEVGVKSDGEVFENKLFAFVYRDLYCSDICFIGKIKIECPFGAMTKACLEYIISGQLTKLEELDLYLRLVESIDENNKPIAMNEGDFDALYIKLVNFCSSSLKKHQLLLLRNDPLKALLSLLGYGLGDNEVGGEAHEGHRDDVDLPEEFYFQSVPIIGNSLNDEETPNDENFSEDEGFTNNEDFSDGENFCNLENYENEEADVNGDAHEHKNYYEYHEDPENSIANFNYCDDYDDYDDFDYNDYNDYNEYYEDYDHFDEYECLDDSKYFEDGYVDGYFEDEDYF